MDFHLPDADGRTISPYYPPLSSPVFGSLLCVSSSLGGCLMPSNNILKFLVIVPIITRHNEQTSPIRSNPHTPSLQRHSHCGRQFIVDCCVLSLNGSHLRPRPHPSLLDEPSLQPGCCCYCCCCYLARLLPLLLLLLPSRLTAAAAAAAGNIVRTILRSVSLLPKEVLVVRSPVRSGKVGVRH